MAAEVVDYLQENEDVFTLRLRLVNSDQRQQYRFDPGQFNMVYLHGVGEVAISIVCDCSEPELINHTIRAVGRATRGLQQLKPGAQIGLRGPYGRGWPMRQAEGRDVVILTGGLGCAPVVAAITEIEQRREQFGRLAILEGVRHHQDLAFPERFEHWSRMARTEVVLCCDHQKAAPWPWHTDQVTDHLDGMEIDLPRAVVMLCGPEGMMIAAGEALLQRGVMAERIWLSLERNMQCGDGFCGHCQLGSLFICRDGPVFNWCEVASLLKVRGL